MMGAVGDTAFQRPAGETRAGLIVRTVQIGTFVWLR